MEQLQYQLKAIRLSGMAQKLQVRLQEARANDLDYQPFLQALVDDELAVRRDRLLNRRLKHAGFPFLRTLSEYDFAFNPGLDKRRIREVCQAGFTARQENVLLLGPPGVGETHLAIACGLNGIHTGFSVLYRSVFDLVPEALRLTEEKFIRSYVKPDLLILDELGMKALPVQATDLLLEVIHRRYQRSSTLIATNRPIEDWGSILGDNAAASAILDRFLENIHFLKITGRSYRLRGLQSTTVEPGETNEQSGNNKQEQKNLEDKNDSK